MQRENRRLAAIVAADIVDYSRLIGQDEEGTLQAMRAHRGDLINPLIEQHGGRIANTAGDSLLLEFASAVDAVRCSIAVQLGMAERNQAVDPDRRVEFRIGINIGDVVAEGDDLLGDGVNVAARLETLCYPGGVILSDDAYRQVRDRLELSWADGGRHEVKNIARAIQVWRWSDGLAEKPGQVSVEADPLPLPDKPSIAVLPFDNMSGDEDQEYLSDGITEDIITALSKFRWFFVTARNSTFTYKGAAINIKQVGRELGVRYVLEGSVRQGGDRVRVTAQLIEAESGNHIWAERYDRDLQDIFELQDEITRTIAAAVEPELLGFERDRAMHKPTEDLDAWSLLQRGIALMWRMDRPNIEAGAELMRQAIDADPNFGQAHGYLAMTALLLLVPGWADDRAEALRQGLADANRAIALDQKDHNAHYVLGRLSVLAGELARGIRALENALTYNPSFAHGYFGLGTAYVYAGEAEKAVENLELAIRLSPNDPLTWAFCAFKGLAHYAMEDLDPAMEQLERSCQFPAAQFIPFVWLASIYMQAGREQDARKMLVMARQREPNLSIDYVKEMYRDSRGKRVEKLIETLREAGLSEE